MNYYQSLKEILINTKHTWLVTGCAGFIGSNLTETLLKLNQKVIGLDNFSTGYRHNLDDIQKNVSDSQWNDFVFFEGDIADYAICEQVTQNVDIILHQAALGSVPRSIKDPINSNLSNVSGFLNILTAAKNNGTKRFVYASSSSVYGDSPELPKVESNIGNPLSPYAVTKYANELYAGVFHKCYGMETIGLRYFNVFGKRQDPNGAYAAVIPKWIDALLHNEPVYINGDGETSRDFTYIENVVQANILAGMTTEKSSFGEVFNTAIGGSLTLNDLYYSINLHLSKLITIYEEKSAIYQEFRQGDIRHSHANINKIKNMLKYEPIYSIEQGLVQYLQWYIKNTNSIKQGSV